MSESYINAVAIFDAIPEGELNTARKLREDIEIIATSLHNGPEVRYFRTESVSSLSDALTLILLEHKRVGLLPMLHIEAHGLAGEQGIAFPNRQYCTWETLKELITPLNIAMKLNLMVVLATCYGGSFASAIRVTDPAPVWGLIGPTREITAGQVQGDFGNFYRTFFLTASGSQAIDALNARAPKQSLYYHTSAEEFFLQVWRAYKRNCCSPKILSERARKMYRQAKASKDTKVPNIGELKRRLQREEPDSFARYRDIYFMYDIYPENQSRFAITYEKAEKYASC
jgi:hypothetical protein